MCWIAALLALALPAHAGLKAVAGSAGASSGGSATGCALNSIWFTQPAATLNCTDANFTWVTGTQTLGLGTTNFLVAEAANTLSQVNSTTAQSLFVYNTKTDASNYERGQFMWTGNALVIGTDKLGTGTSRATNFTLGGTVVASINTSGNWVAGSNNTRDLGATATTWRNLYLGSAVSKVGGVTTSGNQGVPTIVASGRVTAQSAANASISTFTVGAADGSFEVSGNMNVTASTTLATTLSVSYTDESNAARTMILPVAQLAGSFIAAGAITGTGAWESPVMHIRAKAATAITIFTSAGTFTGVTYTAEGIIKQTN